MFDGQWRRGCHESFVEVFNKEYRTKAKDSSSTATTTPVLPQTSLQKLQASMNKRTQGSSAGSRTLVDEIALYLQEPVVDTAEYTCLRWWKDHHGRFPALARMARDYLAIPGTFICHQQFHSCNAIIIGSSVSVERSFSSGRDLVSIRRGSLKGVTIQMLMKSRSTILLQDQEINVGTVYDRKKAPRKKT